jgi:hypothetical protein
LEEKLANELHLPGIRWLQLFTSSRGMARSNFKRAFRAAAVNLPLLNVRRDKRGNQEQILEYYEYCGQVMRVLFTAQDSQTIRDAFGRAKPNTEYSRLYAAAVARPSRSG